ncbi:MAG: hypothetical protein ACE5FD_03620 [Anaerolineae bacterium]
MITPDIVGLSGRDRLAQLLSNIFHPFLVSVVTLALVIYLDGATLLDAIKWRPLALASSFYP